MAIPPSPRPFQKRTGVHMVHGVTGKEDHGKDRGRGGCSRESRISFLEVGQITRKRSWRRSADAPLRTVMTRSPPRPDRDAPARFYIALLDWAVPAASSFQTMKTIVLLIATGVFSFLMGVTTCYLWFQSQSQSQSQNASTTQPVSETSMVDAPTDAAAAPGTRAARFDELDADKDGRLSFTEFAGTRKPAGAEKWFKLRDANSDGFVSREEFVPTSAASKAR